MCKLDALLFHGNRARYFKEKKTSKQKRGKFVPHRRRHLYNTLNAAPSSRHGIRDSALLFHLPFFFLYAIEYRLSYCDVYLRSASLYAV